MSVIAQFSLLKYFVIISFSFFASLLLTPLVKWLAFKFSFLDQPGERKIHNRPIPLLGGVLLYLSLVATFLLFGLLNQETIKILVIGLAFVSFGLLDEKGIKMRARNKILAHLAFSCVVVVYLGIYLNLFRPLWLNWALTACFITFMTNSLNMLDGLDGLVAGISFLIAGFFAILAVNYNQTEIVLFLLAFMGALLGFLRYNFNPASIFLGETGATFCGLILALAAIKLNIYGLWKITLLFNIERLQFVSFIVPLIILGIPIFDTYFVFVNRFLHNIKFSQAGKDHSHHRIHLMGFSQRATVISIYTIQIILGSLALAMINADLQQFIALLGIVTIFFVGFTMFLLRVKVYPALAENHSAHNHR